MYVVLELEQTSKGAHGDHARGEYAVVGQGSTAEAAWADACARQLQKDFAAGLVPIAYTMQTLCDAAGDSGFYMVCVKTDASMVLDTE